MFLNISENIKSKQLIGTFGSDLIIYLDIVEEWYGVSTYSYIHPLRVKKVKI